MKKAGVIGTGNMGSCIAKLLKDNTKLYLSDSLKERAEALSAELPASVSDNLTIAKECDLIFLCVKPNLMADVLSGMAPVLKDRKSGVLKNPDFVLISIAAGITTKDIQDFAGGDTDKENNYPVVRLMPNTSIVTGSGIILYCGRDIDEEKLSETVSFLKDGGMVDRIEEKQIDAAMAVTGCGPAYAYQFIEALSDGLVLCGLPRDKAIRYSAGMLLGSSRLLLSSGKHPGELKDNVCSPAGTTIEGVRVLEEGGFRGLVMDAVIAAYEKSRSLL